MSNLKQIGDGLLRNVKFSSTLSYKGLTIQFSLLFFLLCMTSNTFSQRMMPNLSRGVIALNKGGGQVYVGWRLLGNDPADIAFNLYKSTGGGAPVKVAGPLTKTTDYTVTGVSTASSNSFFVRPIINGIEQAASKAYELPASAPTRHYIRIPQQNEPDGGPYSTNQVHVGDVDGDGDFEFLCMREYVGTNAPTTRTVKIDCIELDGTLLWRLDLGWNFTYTANGSGTMSVADFDGDGKDEVMLRTFEGTCFNYGASDSVRIGDTDGDGKTNYRVNDWVNTGPEFISVIEGATGKEMDRINFEPSTNGDAAATFGANERPLYIYFAVAYLDGVLPSFVSVRGVGGDSTPAFAFDFRNGKITERWRWIPGQGEGLSQAHNILVFDLDNDGKDEIAFLGSALDDDGTILYANRMFTHGDHYRVLDMDPDRPGYEIFSIQQTNLSNLGMSIIDGANGEFIKSYFLPEISDPSRGDAGDYNAATKGAEFHSTMGGLYDLNGNVVGDNRFPRWGIWWDGDLQREIVMGVGGTGMAPAIEKWHTGRLFTMYSDDGAYSNSILYGGHPQFWGDIMGDWREEMISQATDYSHLRLYSTWDPAQNRLYTLMHNPGYKTSKSCKGRIGGSFPDYYLGGGMQTPPPPPMVKAKLHWKGDAENNIWDINTTSNWIDDKSLSVFNQNDTVLFDLTGINSAPITIAGQLNPGQVTFYSPIDYTLNGSGEITGSSSLTKAGKGSLTLDNKNTYTGITEVWDGALIVNDSLKNSDVIVYGGTWGGALSKGLTGGRIGGRGYFGKVTLEYGGSIVPGKGVGFADTITIGTLTEKDATANFIDLSNDPTGLVHKNDIIIVNGDLTIANGITVEINLLNGTLSAGDYTIFKYSGTFTGDVSKIQVNGLDEYPYTITHQNSKIVLSIPHQRPAAKVVWSGTGDKWDLGVSSNWLRDGNSDVFASRDSVIFDDNGSANKTVKLPVSLYASDVIFDGTTNYTISGNGGIYGDGKLIKRGSSTVRIDGQHFFTGATIIEEGTLEVGSINIGNDPSSIGASPAIVGNLELNGGSGLSLISSSSCTDRPIVIKNGECTFSSNNGNSLIFLNKISGNGTLVKKGSGILQFNSSNTYSGGTIIKDGTLLLSSYDANQTGTGTGTITLKGGTLTMADIRSYNSPAWNINVPEGSSGTFNPDGRCSLKGSLTGGGILTLNIPYVRTAFEGNWSSFTGKINVNGDFRIANGYGYENASINMVKGTAYALSNGTAIAFGELSGAAEATLAGGAWTIGAKNTDAIFAGTITGNSIRKIGTGILTLTGANTYTGGTAINGGTLKISNTTGSATGTSDVYINSGGTFEGTSGSIAGGLVNVNSGGKITGVLTVTGTLSANKGAVVAPGNTIGTITVNNNVSLRDGSKLIIDVNSTTGQSDRITVTRSKILKLGGVLEISKQSANPFVAGDTFTIFSCSNISGAFDSIVPAIPAPGLVWDTTLLLSDGIISVDKSSGVSLVSDPTGEILIYPNPTSGIVQINFNQTINEGTLMLENINGQIIEERRLVNTQITNADISTYPTGIYIIKITVDGENYIQKIFKK